MKSYTFKHSSGVQSSANDDNKKCRLRGFIMTAEFSEMKNRSINDSEKNAIICRNVSKWYTNGEPVLSDLNMKVPSGSVYALLGSSGCGKTTLLSCILGMSTVNTGSILVYGENSGRNNVGIPGRNVGFMPQQISLYPEFTIWETFNYFASFGGLTKDECVAKGDFFRQLLKLPVMTRKIGTLSGGQQRRVSFAATLIHEPPLVVLDEPTVGIDPVVRQTIWRFIEELASVKKTTVIITTHYIEEARRANVIGVIRQGKILLEQSPQQLIENTNMRSLEGAVLQVFKSGTELPHLPNGGSCSETNFKNTCAQFARYPKENQDIRGYPKATIQTTRASQFQQTITRIKALTYKNFVVMIRNILLMSFVVWIPAAELYTTNITLEFNPKSLKMGIINHETSGSLCNSIFPNKSNCSIENLSCQYLAAVDSEVVELIHFDSVEGAEAAVHSGWLRGYLIFPSKFSQNLFTMATYGAFVNDSVYNETIVTARFDETNKAINVVLKLALYNALEEFLSNVLSSCDLDPKAGMFPLQYGPPIYGKQIMDFREFVLPGSAIVVTFFFPIIVIGIRLIEERNSGMLTRAFVSGVQSWEIFVSYLLSEFWVLVAQAILVLIVTLVISGIEFAGSIWLVFALLVLNGYCGTSFGILLGSLAREKVEVGILAIAIFMPNIFLTGLCWPIEGMINGLKYVAYILPCTLAGLSMRSIVIRGLEFSDDHVWPGFVVLCAHILFYSTLAMLQQRRNYTK